MGWWGKIVGRASEPREAAPPVPRRTAPAAAAREAAAGGLPRFRATATEQLDGLQQGPIARARMRLRDAFTPSRPVMDPQMFAGRARLLETLIRAIEDQKLHVVLYGDRGVGKTSLLHVLARQAGEARYLVRYASCGEESDFGELFRGVAEDVPLLYHAGYAPTSGETERGAMLADLLPPGKATPRQISALFGKLTGTRLLIVLDEFDRSPSGAFRRQVAELIKTLSDQSVRVQLVIAGVAANLTELVEHIPSIRRNIVGLPMTGMSRDEIGELIRNGERVSGMTFGREAVEMIIALAAGSPYLAGLLAQHAGLAAVDRESVSIDPRDVHVAIGRAAAEIGHRISDRSRHAIDRTPPAHEEALATLAHTALQRGGRFDAEALASVVPDPAARAQVMAAVAEQRLIEPIEGDPAEHYRFVEEGVPTYLWMSRAERGLRAD